MQEPFLEREWDYAQALKCTTPAALPVPVHRIGGFLAAHVAGDGAVPAVQWCSHVLCTENFMNTVVLRAEAGANLGDYLRPLDLMLRFPNQEVCPCVMNGGAMRAAHLHRSRSPEHGQQPVD